LDRRGRCGRLFRRSAQPRRVRQGGVRRGGTAAKGLDGRGRGGGEGLELTESGLEAGREGGVVGEVGGVELGGSSAIRSAASARMASTADILPPAPENAMAERRRLRGGAGDLYERGGGGKRVG